MKEWFLGALIFFGLSSVTSAQLRDFECSPGGVIDPQQARLILERVQSQYARIDSMQGLFRQDSYVAALDEGEQSSGEMIFAKPGRMRWSYKQPHPQEVVIKNGELWLYQPEKKQVIIDDIGNVLLSSLPISFLMGLGNIAKDFEMTSACRAKHGVVVRLVPHGKEGNTGQSDGLEGFDLLVDESKNVPKGAKITSVGGNVTGIVFENLQLRGVEVDPRIFVLEYPKGVDILDRRLKAGS